MAKLVTLEAVNEGKVSVRQLLTLNSLMDAENYQRELAEAAEKRGKDNR